MRALLAAFKGPEPLAAAARAAQAEGLQPLDAFTPFPTPELARLLGVDDTRVPWWMLLGGSVAAVGFFLMEALSAVRLYPFNSGGRPYDSWPDFLLAPTEVGILAAGTAGFAAFLMKGRLPALHHPLFESAGFERASRDQFLLALAASGDETADGPRRERLLGLGALWVEAVEL